MLPRFEFPLVRRELLGLLRTRRAFWIAFAFAALAVAAPIFSWPSRDVAAVYSQENRGIFMVFAVLQLTLAMFIVPVFAAGAIAGEREQGTYDLLYTTLLPPFTFILSKLLAATIYVLILLTSTIPPVWVRYLLGGFDFASVLCFYATTLAAVILTALISLTSSLRSRKTGHALIKGILWTFFWNVGLFLIVELGLMAGYSLFRWSPRGMGLVQLVVGGLTPYSGVFAASALPHDSIVSPFTVYLGYAGILGAAHLAYLCWKVRVPDLASRRVRPLRPGARPPPPRRCLLARGLIRLGEAGVPFLSSPFFLRELRSELVGRPWFRRVAFWCPLGVFTLISFTEAPRQFQAMAVAQFTLLFIALVAPGLGGYTFPHEVSAECLDLLRGTRSPLREVFWGKMLAAVYGGMGLIAGAAWSLAIAAFLEVCDLRSFAARGLPFEVSMSWVAFTSLATLAISLAFMTTLSGLLSVLFRRTLAGVACAYAANMAILLGVPMVLLMNGWDPDSGYRGAVNPYTALVISCTDSDNRRNGPDVWCIFALLYGGASIFFFLTGGFLADKLRSRER